MLAPHSEGWPGEERLLRLGLASLALWHGGFLDGLPDERDHRARFAGGRRRPRRRRRPEDRRGVAGGAGPSGDLHLDRPRYRTASRAGHSARLPGRDRARRRQQGVGRGAGGRTASGSACSGRRRSATSTTVRRRRAGDRQRHRRARAVAGPADPPGQGRGAAAAMAHGLYAGAAEGDSRPRARPTGLSGAAPRWRRGRRDPVRARPRHRAGGVRACGNCSTTPARSCLRSASTNSPNARRACGR